MLYLEDLNINLILKRFWFYPRDCLFSAVWCQSYELLLRPINYKGCLCMIYINIDSYEDEWPIINMRSYGFIHSKCSSLLKLGNELLTHCKRLLSSIFLGTAEPCLVSFCNNLG